MHVTYDASKTSPDGMLAELRRQHVDCTCEETPTAPTHSEHGAHKGHSAAMIGDMLRKVVVSAVLTIPIILYSPVGQRLGFTGVLQFSIPQSYLGFPLATPIVFWAGSVFLSSAWRAFMRRRSFRIIRLAATSTRYVDSRYERLWFTCDCMLSVRYKSG
jgi:cation transport ATPase